MDVFELILIGVLIACVLNSDIIEGHPDHTPYDKTCPTSFTDIDDAAHRLGTFEWPDIPGEDPSSKFADDGRWTDQQMEGGLGVFDYMRRLPSGAGEKCDCGDGKIYQLAKTVERRGRFREDLKIYGRCIDELNAERTGDLYKILYEHLPHADCCPEPPPSCADFDCSWKATRQTNTLSPRASSITCGGPSNPPCRIEECCTETPDIKQRIQNIRGDCLSITSETDCSAHPPTDTWNELNVGSHSTTSAGCYWKVDADDSSGKCDLSPSYHDFLEDEFSQVPSFAHDEMCTAMRESFGTMQCIPDKVQDTIKGSCEVFVDHNITNICEGSLRIKSTGNNGTCRPGGDRPATTCDAPNVRGNCEIGCLYYPHDHAQEFIPLVAQPIPDLTNIMDPSNIGNQVDIVQQSEHYPLFNPEDLELAAALSDALQAQDLSALQARALAEGVAPTQQADMDDKDALIELIVQAQVNSVRMNKAESNRAALRAWSKAGKTFPKQIPFSIQEPESDEGKYYRLLSEILYKSRSQLAEKLVEIDEQIGQFTNEDGTGLMDIINTASWDGVQWRDSTSIPDVDAYGAATEAARLAIGEVSELAGGPPWSGIYNTITEIRDKVVGLYAVHDAFNDILFQQDKLDYATCTHSGRDTIRTEICDNVMNKVTQLENDCCSAKWEGLDDMCKGTTGWPMDTPLTEICGTAPPTEENPFQYIREHVQGSLDTIVSDAITAVDDIHGFERYLQVSVSDERLKEELMRLGTSPSGVPIFRWRYKMQPESLLGDMAGRVFYGTTAQELLKMGREDAVIKDKVTGYWLVDYRRLDVEFGPLGINA